MKKLLISMSLLIAAFFGGFVSVYISAGASFTLEVWGTVGDWIMIVATISLAIVGWFIPVRLRSDIQFRKKQGLAEALLYELSRYYNMVSATCAGMEDPACDYLPPLPDPIILPQTYGQLFDFFEVQSGTVIECYRFLDSFNQAVKGVNEYYKSNDRSALITIVAKEEARKFKCQCVAAKEALQPFARFNPSCF